MRRCGGGVIVLFLLVILLCTSVTTPASKKKKKHKGKGGPLYNETHPNITFLDDSNLDQQLSNPSNVKPWLVEMYHPFCPHCRKFVPDMIKLAAHYKELGTINIGALSCRKSRKCLKAGVNDFPTLIAYNFNPKKRGENSRVIGSHELPYIYKFVDRMTEEGIANSTQKSGPKKRKPKELPAGEKLYSQTWEESPKVRRSSAKNRLRDAASAYIFALRQSIFLGVELLEDNQLDALKEWLRLTSLTFPGSFNRQLIGQLYQTLVPITYLDINTWETLLQEWQVSTKTQYQVRNKNAVLTQKVTTKNAWMFMTDIFSRNGTDYSVCESYDCAQWLLFHMMTVNQNLYYQHHDNTTTTERQESYDDNLLIGVVMGIRRFIKNFFGCAQCRTRFFKMQTLSSVSNFVTKSNLTQALPIWMWSVHNRINSKLRHPKFPKKESCDACTDSVGRQNITEVANYLQSYYGYKETFIVEKHQVDRNIRQQPPSRTEKESQLYSSGMIQQWPMIALLLSSSVLLGLYYQLTSSRDNKTKRRKN